MIEIHEARKVAEQMAAIAEPTRLRVLVALAGGAKSVGELAKALGVTLANVSHHLNRMRLLGVLDSERAGRSVNYSLRPGVFTPGTVAGTLGVLRVGWLRVTLPSRESQK